MRKVPFILATMWIMFWVAILCIVASMISPKACAENTMKIGVFVDSSDITEERAYALIREAEAIYRRNGLHLVFEVDSFEQIKPSAHSNPWYVLDDVIETRTGPERNADVYVLLTRRTLMVGSSVYAGVATTGPACSSWGAAVVSLFGEGSAYGDDAHTLAHELAHTFGVEHDKEPGYLMSANVRTTDVMSSDTLGVIRGSYLDCMQAPAQVPSGTSASTQPAGGGGSLHLWFLMTLVALLWLSRSK